MIEGLGCVGTASMYVLASWTHLHTPWCILPSRTHPTHLYPPTLPSPHTSQTSHSPTQTCTPHTHSSPHTLSHPSLALTSPPLTGGKHGFWHSVPSRIAVNMIICCASGGTLAVLVASWMQVGPAHALGPDYTTSTVLQ